MANAAPAATVVGIPVIVNKTTFGIENWIGTITAPGRIR